MDHPDKGAAIVLQPEDGDSFWQPVPANGYASVKVSPWNAPVDRFAMGVQVVAPGGRIREHDHDRHEELTFFWQGRGRAIVDGVEHPITPGTTIYTGRRVKHCFINDGEAELKSVNINDGLTDTLRLVQHNLVDRIEVITDLAAIDPIICYPSRLNHVFLCLLDNAIAAIEDRGRIEISTRREGDRLYVAGTRASAFPRKVWTRSSRGLTSTTRPRRASTGARESVLRSPRTSCGCTAAALRSRARPRRGARSASGST